MGAPEKVIEVIFFKAALKQPEGGSAVDVFHHGYAERITETSREIVCENVQVPRWSFRAKHGATRIAATAQALGRVTFPKASYAIFSGPMPRPSWFKPEQS